MEFTLNDGNKIPALGLGTYKMHPEDTVSSVLSALKLGYRHIDTAAYYGNEKEVGIAIQKSGIPREDIFVTTKIWNDQHDDPRKAFEKSLKNLGLKYIDLYLIHWPVPERYATWKILEKIKDEGLAKSIGVSNFMVKHLAPFLERTETIPAVNQFELHPFNFPKDTIDLCRKHNIQTEAYSPLTRGAHFNHPLIQSLSQKYGRTPAQIHLRWAFQHGAVVIPKSTHEERQKENMDFDFIIEPNDMIKIDNIGIQERVAPDPNQFD